MSRAWYKSLTRPLLLTAPLALALLVAAVTLADSPKSDQKAPAASAPKIEWKSTSQPSATPAPGIYASVPYSAIVVVPPETDTKFVITPPKGAVESTVQPPVYKLVPR